MATVEESTEKRSQEMSVVEKTIEEESRFLNIISNDLIGDKIMSYLSFTDTIVLSEVNKAACRIIRQSVCFKRKVILVISSEKEWSKFFEIPIVWRNVRIIMDDCVSLNVPLYPLLLQNILRHVEFLSVVPRKLENESTESICQLTPSNFCDLLRSTPNLTHLHIDARFFQFHFCDLLWCKDIKVLISNLKHLDIRKWNHQTDSYKQSCVVVRNCLEEMEEPNIRRKSHSPLSMRKVQHLFQLTCFATKLQTLRLCNVYGGQDTLYPVKMYIAPILRASCETLEEVVLNNTVWSLEELKTLEFPQLKRLTAYVRADRDRQKKLIDFLRRHTMLEQLDVNWENCGEDEEIWQVIVERSLKLMKLHLTRHMESPSMRSVDWSFLKSMTLLKDFSLELTSSRYIPNRLGVRILMELPRNQLNKIRFVGAWGTSGFWDERVDYANMDTKNQPLKPGGFKFLRRLAILDLDDELMQRILCECRYLEELEIRNSERLTYRGFSGTGMNSGGRETHSLNNLKGLTSLNLYFDIPLQPMERMLLISSISVPALRHFRFDDEENVSKFMLWVLLKNNSSLETITVNMRSQDDANLFLVRAKSFGYRLRKVTHRFYGEISYV